MSELKPRDSLKEKKAMDLFYSLVKAYETQNKEMDDTALHIINDIAMLEEIKEGCRQYIAKKSVMVEWQNGANQGGDRENPLIAKLNQTTEQQRKMLNELKLTPASRKVVVESSGADDFDKF